ncbi:TetR/AcrR family transcriptional regulator [Herbiconiux sp. KACC 21604]|uniref:TetR/AcrR family transcriptional regulator n=1 Tax=unclassified Herbiconiux TaxID=2618217 RepID=UPI0014926B93|nr:TetR/AcrR family transcriptional regulator [Herbiconiux sp. SALV-R1]QJU52556.1 TetR/AcrR family transcriptional regulator [Herbiconiux sp. SALV-R1]WPO87435.1 TetR/AcrR family transcriptional regulator [Herbiconiux sp. KACC 21604]
MSTDALTGPGRPRDPEVERSILTATQDLLIERGYGGTTIAAVAARARCGKSAIYRRWDTKAALVVAAVAATQQKREVPDTGNLRDDLLAAASHFADSGDRAALVLSRILSEIGRDPELYQAARESIGGPPVAVLVAVIERWTERGVVPSGIPVELIAGIVPTAAFGSVTLRQRALELQSIRELVDFVLLPALAR